MLERDSKANHKHTTSGHHLCVDNFLPHEDT